MARMTKTTKQQEYLLHPEKRGTMQLPVAIDEAHIARLDARLRSITTELLSQDEKKKTLVAPINKRMAELREEQKNLVQQIKSGQTMADVVVEERANFETGEAWMIRKDTGDEVPDTRRALTQVERQAFTRGGADGELEPTAHRRVEERGEDEEDDELLEVEVPELKNSPFQHPVVASPGEASLHLEAPFSSWSVRWPVVGTDVYFYQYGAPMGSAAWDRLGGEDGKGGWRRSGDTARIASGALDATAAAIRAGTFTRPDPTELITESAPGAAESLVDDEDKQDASLENEEPSTYRLPAKEGSKVDVSQWHLTVVEGQAMLRQPDGSLVGPFCWDSQRKVIDRVDESVTDEWWEKHELDVLPAVDELVDSGTVREAFSGYTPPKHSSQVEGEASRTGVVEETSNLVQGIQESDTAAPAEGSDVELTPSTARAVAEALSGYAPKVLLLLKARGRMMATSIGVSVQTAKPGAVLNRMLRDGLLNQEGTEYELSKKGASVASALEELESGRKKKATT